jgi:hypothetical protein
MRQYQASKDVLGKKIAKTSVGPVPEALRGLICLARPWGHVGMVPAHLHSSN